MDRLQLRRFLRFLISLQLYHKPERGGFETLLLQQARIDDCVYTPLFDLDPLILIALH